MLSVGLMSGTSMDGIDAALLRTDGTPAMLVDLGHISLVYHENFKLLLKVAESSVRANLGNMDQARNQYRENLSKYLSNVLQINENEKSTKETELLNYLNNYLKETY